MLRIPDRQFSGANCRLNRRAEERARSPATIPHSAEPRPKIDTPRR
jgi:hypothetical protein